VVQLPAISSTERLRASASELDGGSEERAVELADDAVEAEGFAASPFVQRALAREALGDLEGAEADLRSATEREPTNWRHPLLLARVLARQRDREAMRAQLSSARKLSPSSPYLIPGSAYLVELQALAGGGG
jgi:Flp pilus assembly protein TadD